MACTTGSSQPASLVSPYKGEGGALLLLLEVAAVFGVANVEQLTAVVDRLSELKVAPRDISKVLGDVIGVDQGPEGVGVPDGGDYDESADAMAVVAAIGAQRAFLRVFNRFNEVPGYGYYVGGQANTKPEPEPEPEPEPKRPIKFRVKWAERPEAAAAAETEAQDGRHPLPSLPSPSSLSSSPKKATQKKKTARCSDRRRTPTLKKKEGSGNGRSGTGAGVTKRSSRRQKSRSAEALPGVPEGSPIDPGRTVKEESPGIPLGLGLGRKGEKKKKDEGFGIERDSEGKRGKKRKGSEGEEKK